MNLFDTAATEFQRRHIGPDEQETAQMLKAVGVSSLEELIDKTVPDGIRMPEALALPAPMSESEYLHHIKNISLKNKVAKTTSARVLRQPYA
jgi:glycine dehydrogenase